MANDLITNKAIELAQLIKEDDRCKRMQLSNIAFEANFELKTQLSEFNGERDKLFELINQNGDKEMINKLNAEVKAKYDDIMKNPVMIEYENARKDLDSILKQIDSIINYYITGEESPESCDPSKCAGCAGCGR